MEAYIKAKDINLFYKKDIVENSKGTILINHGFAEHLGRYDYVASELNKAGYSTYRYDVRGHGRTTGDKGYIESYKDFIDDLDRLVEFIKIDNKPDRLYTLGHSMGGLITAMYGLNYPNKLDGQIFSGPAIGSLPAVRGIKKPLLKILSSLLPKFKIKNVVEDQICSDPAVVKAYKEDDLVLKEATAKFYREFSITGVEYFLENMGNYSYPVLICHGEKDIIVPNELSKEFYEEMKSKDKSIIIYENLYHEILNEKERDTILKDMVNWLDERL